MSLKTRSGTTVFGAKLALEEMVPVGTRARLEFDVQKQDESANARTRPHTRWYLANRAVVRRGYAIGSIYQPNVRHVETLRAAADSALTESSLLHGKGDYEGAERLYLETLRIWRHALGERHPQTRGATRTIAAFDEEWDRPEMAAQLRPAMSDRPKHPFPDRSICHGGAPDLASASRSAGSTTLSGSRDGLLPHLGEIRLSLGYSPC